MSLQRLAVVAVKAPMIENLTYLQNENFDVKRGDVVVVPLGFNKKSNGIVTKVFEATEDEIKAYTFGLKPIISLDLDLPQLSESYLKWLEWIADYYIFPLGLVLQYCFPILDKTKKQKKINHPSGVPIIDKKAQHKLNEFQQKCFDDILQKEGFSTHLLHGVTGSGKTEIYLELFQHMLNKGKRGLFLLPEISLTPQLVRRFSEKFGNEQIAILHSQLTDRERTINWWDIAEGRKKILIGARSALFCPIDNLGLVVVDEEHETSFKQEADLDLKYNGRDCAIMLGYHHSCPVILGSATPSLESWKNAQDKKFNLHQIKNRVHNRPLPDVQVVDMRLEKDLEKKSLEKPNWLSQTLYNQMKLTLQKNEQVALLLNRRGIAQTVFCSSCGYTAECPNCDISLTLHANVHLVCHYCDYHQNFKVKCPDCKEGELTNLGLGTEKVEEDLKRLFPESSIARADRDEISSRAEMEELIKKMETSEIDILIGTQMIAKGLDFPNLTLVGLLLADISFNFPDFRSSEKSFQLMTQMSGRSGRHVKDSESPGKVIIQTYNTEHESILYTKNHDYEGFAETELNNRKQLNYPPFHKIISLRIQSPDLGKVKQTAEQLFLRAQTLKNKFSAFDQIEILGPSAAPLAKLRNQFRYHLLLKSAHPKNLNQFVRSLIGNSKWITKQTKIIVDIDPLNLL